MMAMHRFQGPFEGPGGFAVHHGAWQAWIPMILLLVLVGLVIWAVIRATSGKSTPQPAGPATDPAMDTLRMTYAKGEIDRDEFVTRARDLGAPVPES